MPEIRQNIVTREWAIIATERARRPEQFVRADVRHTAELPPFDMSCPFCPGNEELELEQLRLPAGDMWQLRVVTNRYPALRADAAGARQNNGPYVAIGGVGYHEVVIETPLHNISPALESPAMVEQTLLAFQVRSAVYRQNALIEHIVYFKNHGPSAGTSLVHPHAQIVALPVVPTDIRARSEQGRHYFDEHGICSLCRMLQYEEEAGLRIVDQSDHYTAFVPYAALSPFHLWIVPRRHVASFSNTSAAEIADLALVLRNVLRRLYFGLNDPDYNYVIRSAPEAEHAARHTHWYISVVPRVTHTAGFELGTGMYINTALPEASAQFLRDVQLP
ncbi:MAG TPA: galactose-1-phosphate uridylyltransferase [Roseiflexaceae bacterium]|nr:galactose-1-phosphate uridylyltransferase [Roseiflexaceae bacterium]HMP42764.1 galactose-1-phosphate uridylyltransferase [Roseiflexaceae bacterium]